MPLTARTLKRMLLVAIWIVFAWVVPWALLAEGQEQEALEIPAADIDLVEHSGEIFVGTIDIVIGTYEVLKDCEGDCGPGVGTYYTVLVSDVLKGKLEPQSIIVLQQDGGTLSGVAEYHEGDGPWLPGNEYLFFARYAPGTPVYRITEPVAGNLPIASVDDRAALIAYWSEVVARTACEQTDILKLDGVIYARRDWNDGKCYLEREWVGPTVATVRFQDTTATGCRDDLGPAVASEIPSGTKVQELKGYATSFRVAVRLRDGHRYLYEAIQSETAETGADLLDIEGRVSSMSYERIPDTVECDDTAMCAASPELITDDQAVISQVLAIISESPVDPERTNYRTSPPERLQLDFTLEDGSTVNVQISLRTGLTPSGIEVPVDKLMELLGID
jgi:hypothetical protein